MTSITIYDGTKTIGGNKIYLREKNHGLFLDFGMNFKKYRDYFQQYLQERYSRGIYDLIQLKLIPKLKNYRRDLIPSDLDISSFPSLDIDAVLLSHSHMDHFGNISLLDEEIPIVASPTSIVLLKAIRDCSIATLNNEIAYFTKKIQAEDGRILKTDKNSIYCRKFFSTNDFSPNLDDFLSIRFRKKEIEKGDLCALNEFSTPFEIKAFEVDHSIYGATAYIISGENTVAYSGDFRLHGKKSELSENFIKSAKNASILIIEGTRATKKDFNEPEEIIYQNCLKLVEISKDLVIADFTARNFERLESFQEIAKKVGRRLIITTKDAYLLKALEKVDGINRTKDMLIYKMLKVRPKRWEDFLFKSESDINLIDPMEISKNPEQYLLCFSFFDVKNLLDIKPIKGTYIYSSSEAFEEESEFDFIRLNNWLKHFGFEIHGFEIIEQKGKLKPDFVRGYHASGHLSQNEIRWAIERIDPDVIIPVHTENPQWFGEKFENAVLLRDDQTFTI
ncbi:MAG: MBL fold metallo-hydrolase [Candidatus Hermodarchaeota archaeon]